MPLDFIPDSYPNRFTWLVNLSAGLATHGATLGLTPAQITDLQSFLAPFIEKYQALLDAKSALDAATGAANDHFNDNNEDLRRRINGLKTAAG